MINDCLNIENNIEEINKINLNMKKYNIAKNKIEFFKNEDNENKISEKIKNFGVINEYPFSQIIKTEDYIKINEMIGGNNKFLLIFSAKRDGCNTDIFHEKCDNISGCIIVCKIEGGDVVGGYLTAKIEKKDEYVDDNKAFFFNLSQNIIKRNKKSSSNAIKNFKDSSGFIRFGNSCKVFYLSGNCLNSNDSKIDTCGCTTNFECEELNLLNKTGGINF